MSVHRVATDHYYADIVAVLKTASAACVPWMSRNCLKPFWSEELDRLKTVSIDVHALWRQVGSPKSGVINAAQLTAKLNYKPAIKQTAAGHERNNADELNRQFAARNSKNF